MQREIKRRIAGPWSHFLKQFTTWNPVTNFFKSPTKSSTGSSLPPQVSQMTTRVPQLPAALTFKAESSIKKTLQTLSVRAGPCALGISWIIQATGPLLFAPSGPFRFYLAPSRALSFYCTLSWAPLFLCPVTGPIVLLCPVTGPIISCALSQGPFVSAYFIAHCYCH